jgi:hypothetical protein
MYADDFNLKLTQCFFLAFEILFFPQHTGRAGSECVCVWIISLKVENALSHGYHRFNSSFYGVYWWVKAESRV